MKRYSEELLKLVRFELQTFRLGVLPRATEDLEGMAETAAEVSESLVTILRKRMMLPALTELLAEESQANPV